MSSNWFVYILQCADSSLYTGITTDIERRLAEHNGLLSGGARYTKSRQPVSLVYQEEASSRATASQREYAIKKLTRLQKETIISNSQQRFQSITTIKKPTI